MKNEEGKRGKNKFSPQEICARTPKLHYAQKGVRKWSGEMKEYRRLWRDAFGDTEQYMDYYFSRKAVRSEVFEDREKGKLCSMAFFTMYDAVLFGQNCRLPYIVGVATVRERRHEGRMTRVLLQGMEKMREKGCPLVFLSPADPAIYEPLGFVPGGVRETTILEGNGRFSLRVRSWEMLSQEEKERAAVFAEDRLIRENLDLHLVHHKEYYDEVHRELHSLGGGLLVLDGEDGVEGVANWIVEDGRQEVTELICKRESAHLVMESLQAWCEGKKLIIEDSTFISQVDGTGIRKERQDKPCLMYRMTGQDTPVGLRCYINDIT